MPLTDCNWIINFVGTFWAITVVYTSLFYFWNKSIAIKCSPCQSIKTGGGSRICQVGWTPTYYSAKFSWEMHGNEENCTEMDGARPKCYYVMKWERSCYETNVYWGLYEPSFVNFIPMVSELDLQFTGFYPMCIISQEIGGNCLRHVIQKRYHTHSKTNFQFFFRIHHLIQFTIES